MKIGILTFHDGMNHGGFLQAYALARCLQKMGADATIIHYRNRKHLSLEYRGLLVRYNPLNICRNIAKIFVFKRAQRRMPLTQFTTSVQEVREMGFDAIVVGSDIVWNFKWEFLGADRIYFGRGLETSRLVAYAPSFGAAAGCDDVPDDIVVALKAFHALSVRDEESYKMLQRVLPKATVHSVLDPTFLVDWNSEAQKCSLPERFLLVYAFELREEEMQAARRYAKEAGLVTVAVGYRQRWCEVQKVAICPFEYLYCFEKASAVLTSTFHGTLFALHYRKAFYTSCNDAIEPKTRGLLGALGIGERLGDDAKVIPALLSHSPDYGVVGPLLEERRTQSLEYLKHALDL